MPGLKSGTTRAAESGGASFEALLEVVIAIVVLPTVLCCAMQLVLGLVGVVMPWLALVAIATIAVGALAAAAAARPHGPLPPDVDRNELPPPPPVRRPAGDQGFRR